MEKPDPNPENEAKQEKAEREPDLETAETGLDTERLQSGQEALEERKEEVAAQDEKVLDAVREDIRSAEPDVQEQMPAQQPPAPDPKPDAPLEKPGLLQILRDKLEARREDEAYYDIRAKLRRLGRNPEEENSPWSSNEEEHAIFERGRARRERYARWKGFETFGDYNKHMQKQLEEQESQEELKWLEKAEKREKSLTRRAFRAIGRSPVGRFFKKLAWYFGEPDMDVTKKVAKGFLPPAMRAGLHIAEKFKEEDKKKK